MQLLVAAAGDAATDYVNTRDLKGRSALLNATVFGWENVAEYLVAQCGADVNARSDNGLTPLRAATFLGLTVSLSCLLVAVILPLLVVVVWLLLSGCCCLVVVVLSLLLLVLLLSAASILCTYLVQRVGKGVWFWSFTVVDGSSDVGWVGKDSVCLQHRKHRHFLRLPSLDALEL